MLNRLIALPIFFGVMYLVFWFTMFVGGFLLKHTLFRGEVSHFVMELPPYHTPRLRFVLGQAWHRLWHS